MKYEKSLEVVMSKRLLRALRFNLNHVYENNKLKVVSLLLEMSDMREEIIGSGILEDLVKLLEIDGMKVKGVILELLEHMLNYDEYCKYLIEKDLTKYLFRLLNVNCNDIVVSCLKCIQLLLV